MLKIISKPYKKQIGNSGKYKFVIAKCSCGNIKEYRLSYIKNGHTKSCGCYSRKITKEIMTKHGLSDTRIYSIWKGMKNRCNNKNSSIYKYYGGKGIKICKEWKNDFMDFYNWAINNKYKENLTIDRINSENNYEPKNCQWITIGENVAKSNKNRNPKFIYYITNPNDITEIKYNRRKIRDEFKISDTTITQLLNKEIENYNGWKLKREKYKK